MLAYRADVLRFFLPQLQPTGQNLRIANGSHEVKLPDSGSGNQVPSTSGVSLVVIYRDPNPAAPMKSIVIYDGGHTMDESTEGMTQTIRGFYQASSTNPSAKMTHIVGDGQSNFLERVLFEGQVIAGPGSNPPVPAPFVGAAGCWYRRYRLGQRDILEPVTGWQRV